MKQFVLFSLLLLSVACNSALSSSSKEEVTPLATEVPTQVIDEGYVVQSNSSNVPVAIVLEMDRAVGVGETAVLTWTLSSAWDQAVEGLVELPSGMDLVDGDLNWAGSLKAGQQQTLTATITVEAEGQHGIHGVIRTPATEDGTIWSDAVYLYLTVNQDGAFFGLPSGTQTGTGNTP